VGAHESLLGMIASSDNDERKHGDTGAQGAAAEGDRAKPGTVPGVPIAAAAVAADRVALASACLANMALEHEAVKEAIVGAEDCLRSICDSALNPSAGRRDVGSDFLLF